jgi:hypothetical protein
MARSDELVYGGLPLDKNSCDPGTTTGHSCPLLLVGPLYMSGELYWTSPDLAAFITSPQLDRKSLAIGHEDVDIGNFVHGHLEPMHIAKAPKSRVLRNQIYYASWKVKANGLANK